MLACTVAKVGIGFTNEKPAPGSHVHVKSYAKLKATKKYQSVFWAE